MMTYEVKKKKKLNSTVTSWANKRGKRKWKIRTQRDNKQPRIQKINKKQAETR